MADQQRPTPVRPDPDEWTDELLRRLSPRLLARLVRGLDSRLASIEYDRGGTEDVLTYTFDVAGLRRSFRLAVGDGDLESIADLYPEAAVGEQQLGERFGLSFQPSDQAAAHGDGGRGASEERRP